YSLNSEEGEIVAGAPGFTYYFDMGTIVSGCTDSHALNYDPSANCHACSCIYPCEGDFNYDNQVALPDLLLFLSAFDCDWNCCRFDLSGDGVINTGDFLLLSSAFGGVCD
ncbi:MAG: hypothetical protein JNM00_03715, partial [Flavobacteriales bacterium]|nr:hypothetical protein [Flavobacteriales bacterium]